MARRARRTFTPEFKAGVILELLSGKQSGAELCRQHQLSPNLLSLWRGTFVERLPVVFQAEEQRSQELARIAELEQLVGQQALELQILKKASRLLTGPTQRDGRWS
jgi:transposase